MTTAWMIFIGLILWNAVCFFVVGRVAYRRGFSDGHKRGRAEENKWWIGTEEQVDQTRQQIWREEPKR